MSEVVSKVIPIILLITLGLFFRHKQVFRQGTIDELKKFLVNYALSAVLFITFFNMEIKKEYYLIPIVVLILLNIFFAIGLALNKIKRISNPLLPYVITACTIAFLGLSIFPSIFGEENLSKIAVIAVGHEIFVWVILYPYMGIDLGNKKLSMNSVINSLKAPTFISIIIGTAFNIFGFRGVFQTNQFLKGLYITIEYLSKLSTPFILIIIGYGLKINKKYLKQSSVIVAIRLVVMLGIGYVYKFFIINQIIGFDKIFDYAYFTFLILPPLLSMPLFVGLNSTPENEELANAIVVLNTIVSLTVYLIFVLLI